jgi:L-asparaginase
MDHATWLRLADGVKQQLARTDVAGVVVTHGTDTLEETAYFLHRCVAADKPVVLTAAMRPASAASPDGPRQLRRVRDGPQAELHPAASMLGDPARWPVVDIVTSHAGARGATMDALVAAGAQGIVIAGTGNGSVHHSLMAAAQRAQAAGVPVRRSSRCILGGVVGVSEQLASVPSTGVLTPVQARIELMLDLIAGNE